MGTGAVAVITGVGGADVTVGGRVGVRLAGVGTGVFAVGAAAGTGVERVGVIVGDGVGARLVGVGTEAGAVVPVGSIKLGFASLAAGVAGAT